MRVAIFLVALLLQACTTTSSGKKEFSLDSFDLEKRAYDGVKALGEPAELITQNDLEPQNLGKLLSTSVTLEKDRNRLQAIMLARSQARCSEFISRLHYTRASMNTSTSMYANIASTAAAIVSGRAGQNLAGFSSIMGFYGNTLNQEFYGGILMPALTEEINSKREVAYSEIVELQKKDITAYPFPMAVMDALKFHDMCSIPYALVGLINNTTSTTKANFSSAGAVASIDNEIDKQKSLLTGNLGFSSSQQEKIRQDILDLTKRREILTISYPDNSKVLNPKPISTNPEN